MLSSAKGLSTACTTIVTNRHVPRHREVKNPTAVRICKDLSVPVVGYL